MEGSHQVDNVDNQGGEDRMICRRQSCIECSVRSKTRNSCCRTSMRIVHNYSKLVCLSVTNIISLSSLPTSIFKCHKNNFSLLMLATKISIIHGVSDNCYEHNSSQHLWQRDIRTLAMHLYLQCVIVRIQIWES